MDALPGPGTTPMAATRAFLELLGLPGREGHDLADSPRRFPDGAQFRLELPGIQNPLALRAAIAAARARGLTLHRITHTIGIMRNTDDELREMCRVCAGEGLELNLSVGPRATYDIGAQVHTPEGGRIGYRLRGVEQLVRGIEDVKRAVGFGARCVMLYDEGMLWVVAEMKTAGHLPADLHIKVSGHTGHCNPASMALLERLGANSVNPVRDLDVPSWAALRRGTSLPLDFSAEAPKSSGGFLRDYDAPEIVRVAAPVYVKSGGGEMATHAAAATEDSAQAYVRRMELVRSTIARHRPELVQSGPAPADLAVPV